MRSATLPFLFALLALSARAEIPGDDLSAADRAVLRSVIRNCDVTDDGFLDDRIDEEMSIYLISQSFPSTDGVIYVYAPKTWDIIIAAAKRLRKLGLLITDEQFTTASLREKIMTPDEFRALGGATDDCSTEREIGRCGPAEIKVARILFGISPRECGGENRWQPKRKNVLRPLYSRLLKALWSRGEDYDPVQQAWRPGQIWHFSAKPPTDAQR